MLNDPGEDRNKSAELRRRNIAPIKRGGGPARVTGKSAFCPYEGRLMIFDQQQRNYFCPECGYTPKLEETPYSGPSLVTADGYTSKGSKSNGSGAMKLRPIPNRSKLRRKFDKNLPENRYEGWDADLKRLISQGYVVYDTSEDLIEDEGNTEYL